MIPFAFVIGIYTLGIILVVYLCSCLYSFIDFVSSVETNWLKQTDDEPTSDMGLQTYAFQSPNNRTSEVGVQETSVQIA